ncbi:Arsenical resistance operon trans-acting repressor ArsD [Tessaracoccus bendigoensis DSM 12906]|uniref:Arsenical resistance operon trans-acting repressor ArsD n=1 Tax=Tessaracoccus bendigoensis DSM 12906 TaxID=1123357 RepID=A0A1M6BMU9_9ACTN|nr:arsenite efflux transporter metallochaperone ArsD [Tessaracoccus bendigoensis]SHI50130.1 Arsenical resistance operon trans-acting repressor ArsD [Tessaracoccus bendigoensis DSM 12906]
MIQVFEGPLCCNTGVCGPDPDQALVDFTADLDWLTRQGVSVRRANLAQDPAAFADSAVARAFVQKVGASGLPLIVADDVTVATGRYPSRAELARIAGVEALDENTATGCCGSATPTPAASVCCGDEAPVSSGCCGSDQSVTIQSGSQA